MGNSKISTETESDTDGEQSLHGKINEDERTAKKRNVDSQIRLDGETDSLYDDGLQVEDESATLADTRNSNQRGG